ncbi:MAG: AI-2E family transporter [Patescibacteria group bacterium]|nr:AI-2E family transporter [Patescibacteria group bacterium]
MDKHIVEISWASLWRIAIFALIIAVFYLGRQIILGLFLAIIISSGVEGMVDAMERKGLPRSVGVILIFVIAVLGVILIAYTLVPFIIVELNTIFVTIGKLPEASGSLGFLLSLQTAHSATAVLKQLSNALFSGTGTPLDFLTSTLGNVGLAVSVVASSFYLSLTRDGVERFIKVVVPPEYEADVLRVYERSRRKIGSWFRAQLILSVIMGGIVWGGLTILGVPYALLIALLAALFELIPFIGPIVSGAIAVVAALGVSASLAIYTLIFFIIAQQFESNILVPIVSRRAVDLHPVIVIVALLIGAEVGGFLGIVISVPAAAVFQEVIQEWSSKKRAGLVTE